MKKTLTFVLFVLLCGTTAVAQNIKKATKQQNSAEKRMQKSGFDAKTLTLFGNAIDEYEKCINANRDIGKAHHGLGRIHYLLGNFDLAYIYFKNSSEISDLANEAFMYWLGLGTEQNLPMAMSKYETLAKANPNVWASIYALDYQLGEYAKENPNYDAVELFMDYLYLRSLGKTRDIWLPILIQSADLGYAPAQFDVWQTFNRQKIGMSSNHIPEFDKAFPYLQKSADNNFTPAIHDMGFVKVHDIINGNGKIKAVIRPADAKRAAEWYYKAASDGFPLSQYNLGHYYEHHLLFSDKYSNFEMAHYWYSAAAEQEFGPAKQKIQEGIASYTPQSQSTLNLILNSVATTINAAAAIHNSLNRDKLQAYAPPGSQERTASSLGSTSSSSSAATTTTTSSSTASTTTAQSSSLSTTTKQPQRCRTCSGSGRCNTCSGKGTISCAGCGGKGTVYVIGDPNRRCTRCNGRGTVMCTGHNRCHGNGRCSSCNGRGTS